MKNSKTLKGCQPAISFTGREKEGRGRMTIDH